MMCPAWTRLVLTLYCYLEVLVWNPWLDCSLSILQIPFSRLVPSHSEFGRMPEASQWRMLSGMSSKQYRRQWFSLKLKLKWILCIKLNLYLLTPTDGSTTKNFSRFGVVDKLTKCYFCRSLCKLIYCWSCSFIPWLSHLLFMFVYNWKNNWPILTRFFQ